VHAHHDDLPGVHNLDDLLAVFGFPPHIAEVQRVQFLEEFHYTPRPDATGFGDGHVFDLGGINVEAMHLPGHTLGHSGFHIDGGVFFLSDIDLSGFGPYYGDVWSDLEQFEESLIKVRDVEVDTVERRTAELHLARMMHRSEAEEVAPGTYRRI